MKQPIFYLILFSICFNINKGSSQNTKTKKVEKPTAVVIPDYKLSLTPEKWDFQKDKAEFIEYEGKQAIRLNENSGAIFYKDLVFQNGTIEFDVEVSQASPFPSLYFRQKDNDAEHIYLRTGTVNRKNAFDAIQYASIIRGVNTWDLQHEYQSAANIKIGEWNHVKLVVSGKQLKVYINNPTEPNLEVPYMEGNISEGKIGIGTGFPGQSIFANLMVKPNETEGLSPLPGADITRHDTRYIRNWQVTSPDTLPYGRELNGYNLPTADMKWENINTERRGLVNLSRKFGGHQGRLYVWLRAKIKSESAQTQIIKMGFSDEIWVFINQKPVYVDKDSYIMNMRKSPNGRISLDNCSFPISLIKGDNELLIGVANDFYGWGIMARLEHLDGVEILQ